MPVAIAALVVCFSVPLPAFGTDSITHIFAFDVSGSMQEELADEGLRAIFAEALLGNTGVLDVGDAAISRGFDVESQPAAYRANDPLRLSPKHEIAAFRTPADIESFIRETMDGLATRHRDTDIHQALQLAILDRAHMLGGHPTILWMLTDNWQDVRGVTGGIKDFYEYLAAGELVRDLTLIPILTNPHGTEGNLVIYAVLLADREVPAAVVRYRKSVGAFCDRVGALGAPVEPIACMPGAWEPLEITDHPAPEFEPAGVCRATFRKEGDVLIFEGLEMGIPLTGSIVFSFQSPLTVWRIREADVPPMRFDFSSSINGDLDMPAMALARISPPIIEEIRPGETLEVRHRVNLPDHGIVVPRLRARTLRHYFPGAEVILEGRAYLGIDLDVGTGVILDEEAVESLKGHVRLIDEIMRLVKPDQVATAHQILARTYRTEYHVAVDDWKTWLGLVLLGFIAIALAVLLVRLLAPAEIFYRVGDGDEHPLRVSAVRQEAIVHEGVLLGDLHRQLGRGLAFRRVPSFEDLSQGQPQPLKPGENEFVVLAKKASYRVLIRVP